ncbi:MAG: hypothetical protein K2G53_04645 [Muribaculaceae bacterium]|nr:hypothetical protein [Muribaculaceae bacterium]
MKKILLSIAAATFAMTAFADTTVYFSEDFEWLAPYAAAGKNGNGDPAAGNTVGGGSTEAPKADACKVDGKSALEAMQEKGYSLLSAHNFVNDKGKQDIALYLQENYLKFNKTGNFTLDGKKVGYQEALVLPTLNNIPANTELKVSFDWCSQKQGDGVWDATEMAVIVVNGEDEAEFAAPKHEWEVGGDYSWAHAEVSLKGATINENTKLVIRDTNEGWAMTSAHRFYLDNIKVYSGDESSVAEIAVDENAPVEYYNLQGVRVANPANGLYIVKQGNKVSKQIIK